MRTWFITGVTGGLGRALAQEVAACGDKVVGTTRSATGVVWANDLEHDRIRIVTLDVTDEEAVTGAVRAAEVEHGPLDVVVNNAGYGLVGAIEETSLQQARELFDVNVCAPLAVIKAVLPSMRRRRRGHIINVTSVSGHAVWGGTGVYGASKFALECIGRTLALEVEPLGIRVTNIAPGGLRTSFAGGSLQTASLSFADYEETAHANRRILLGHKGHEPGDPVLAARAIIKVADLTEPPLSLLLGADALEYAEQERAQLADQTTRWRSLTLSTAFSSAAAD